MKLLGAALVFAGALYAFFLHRQRELCTLRLGRTLVRDLAVLKSGICIYRKTIPSLCDNDLKNSPDSECFWNSVRELLAKGELTLQESWERAAETLPPVWGARLMPLGSLLSGGGALLANAIDEVREELLSDLRAEEGKLSASLRLSGALYLSGACLAVLVLA